MGDDVHGDYILQIIISNVNIAVIHKAIFIMNCPIQLSSALFQESKQHNQINLQNIYLNHSNHS